MSLDWEIKLEHLKKTDGEDVLSHSLHRKHLSSTGCNYIKIWDTLNSVTRLEDSYLIEWV